MLTFMNKPVNGTHFKKSGYRPEFEMHKLNLKRSKRSMRYV